jgi:hypothetical protein
VTELLSATVCRGAEGIAELGSFDGCAGISEETRNESVSFNARTKVIVRGGGEAERNKLIVNTSDENIVAFLGTASQGKLPIRYTVKPVWEVLINLFGRDCPSNITNLKEPTAIAACHNKQRALNLQAAYEGIIAMACEENVDEDTKLSLQWMEISGEDISGSQKYQCVQLNEGCHSHDACHKENYTWGSLYCYGSYCVAKEDKPILGTDKYRSRFLPKKDASLKNNESNTTVNGTCKWENKDSCLFNKNKKRVVYEQ